MAEVSLDELKKLVVENCVLKMKPDRDCGRNAVVRAGKRGTGFVGRAAINSGHRAAVRDRDQRRASRATGVAFAGHIASLAGAASRSRRNVAVTHYECSGVYDTIIIGGGPGGSTAGAFLAKAGSACCWWSARFFRGSTLANRSCRLE